MVAVGRTVLGLSLSEVCKPTCRGTKNFSWREGEIPRNILRLVDRYGKLGSILFDYNSGWEDDRPLGLKTGKQ